MNVINDPTCNVMLDGIISDNHFIHEANDEKEKHDNSYDESLRDDGLAMDINDCYFYLDSNVDNLSVYL